MSSQTNLFRVRRLPRAAARALVLGLLLSVPAGPAPAAPAEPKPKKEKHLPAGKCASATGTLLEEDREGKDPLPWHPVKQGVPVATGDPLLALPGNRAEIDTTNGVRLSLWGNLPELSRFPVLESVVVLHENPAVDLDFTLERGRVEVTNRKESGPARVRVRFHGEAWDLTLAERDAEAALELYALWPRGLPFSKKPKQDEVPTVDVVLLMLHGQGDLKAGGAQFALAAPPGPALFHWDSVLGTDRGPQSLKELPRWARPSAGHKPEAEALETALKRQRKRLVDTKVDRVLRDELQEDDPSARELAVYGLGAVNDLGGLMDALGDPKHADTRDRAVEALRHWIGRGPGQDQKLYRFLIDDRHDTEAQAETLLQLLHSFSTADRARPETYEALIAYLRHDKLVIRQLARWHLERLAPAGSEIRYDPAGSEEEREKAYQEWKDLIPEGKLPPRPKTTKPPKDDKG